MVANPANDNTSSNICSCHVVSKILQKSGTDCTRDSKDVAISILFALVSTKTEMAISLQLLVCSGSSCTLGNGSASKPHKPRARGCGCCRFWVPLLRAFLSGSVFYAKNSVITNSKHYQCRKSSPFVSPNNFL